MDFNGYLLVEGTAEEISEWASKCTPCIRFNITPVIDIGQVIARFYMALHTMQQMKTGSHLCKPEHLPPNRGSCLREVLRITRPGIIVVIGVESDDASIGRITKASFLYGVTSLYRL